jgi:hypothetical protein
MKHIPSQGYADRWQAAVRSRQPDGVGAADLYISFSRADGSWTAPVNMGEPMNSPSHDRCPIVTYDGRYLFFTSHRNGNSDNYWVDARIIEGFRPRELRR